MKEEELSPNDFETKSRSRDIVPRFYLPALDGLRTVAFLMVWWTHALRSSDLTTKDRWYVGFVQAGMYGVPVFFVLSAFLITRLLRAEREQTGTIDLKAYYIRRTLRIWPLYFLIVAYTTVRWTLQGDAPPAALLSLATFTANWYQFFTRGLEGHASIVLWSVSVEEQFYLLWPLALSRLSISGLHRLCYWMIAIAFVSRVWLAATRGEFVSIWYSSFSHLDALAFGTLLALRPLPNPLSSPRWYACFSACLVALIVQARCSFDGGRFGALSAVGFTIVPIASAAMVWLALGSSKTFLNHAKVVAIGRLTFGMYCFHTFVLQRTPSHDAPHLIIALIVTLMLAWVSYHLYEKRFLRLKHRFERVPSRPD